MRLQATGPASLSGASGLGNSSVITSLFNKKTRKFKSNTNLGNGSHSRRKVGLVARLPQRPVVVVVALNLILLLKVKLLRVEDTTTTSAVRSASRIVASGGGVDSCLFRPYPPHRYYDLNDRTTTMDFLRSSEYIYGEWPIVLPTIGRPQKLCVDQSEWRHSSGVEEKESKVWPFADGTNPSILTLQRIRESSPTSETKEWLESIQQHQTSSKKPMFLATVCMTNSQCVWGDPVPENFNNATEPAVVLTALLVLDENFATLYQATITLRRDAQWGKRMPRPSLSAPDGKGEGAHPYYTPALDDARLFVHEGKVWVSYREGKGFGWDTQVLNPIHIHLSNNDNSNSNKMLTAEIWASETASLCCGRNMALMENRNNPHELLSLTWVDPVTIVTVDTTPLLLSQPKHRKLGEAQDITDNADALLLPFQEVVTRDLRLGSIKTGSGGTGGHRKKKSHAHGTNAFMVYLPESNEFLGMAHFHRPSDRNPNPYARFGHHYTHALFTVSASATTYRLTSLSSEFVLPQAVSSSSSSRSIGSSGNSKNHGEDAEIIQFASGLELLGSGFGDSSIVIAYGINDCEAAAVKVSMDEVKKMLRPVSSDVQVVDTMKPLLSSSS